MITKQEQGIGAFGNPYLYKNYYYDTETGLYYLNARYYDLSIGRFLSRDSNGASEKDRLEQNPYLYVKNNPINSEDPSGLKSAYWWYRHNKYLYAKTGKLRYKARMGRWEKIWKKSAKRDINKAAYWAGANQKRLDKAKTKAAQAIEKGNVKDYLKYKDQVSSYQQKINYWSNKLTQAKIQIETKMKSSKDTFKDGFSFQVRVTYDKPTVPRYQIYITYVELYTTVPGLRYYAETTPSLQITASSNGFTYRKKGPTTSFGSGIGYTSNSYIFHPNVYLPDSGRNKVKVGVNYAWGGAILGTPSGSKHISDSLFTDMHDTAWTSVSLP